MSIHLNLTYWSLQCFWVLYFLKQCSATIASMLLWTLSCLWFFHAVICFVVNIHNFRKLLLQNGMPSISCHVQPICNETFALSCWIYCKRIHWNICMSFSRILRCWTFFQTIVVLILGWFLVSLWFYCFIHIDRLVGWIYDWNDQLLKACKK